MPRHGQNKRKDSKKKFERNSSERNSPLNPNDKRSSFSRRPKNPSKKLEEKSFRDRDQGRDPYRDRDRREERKTRHPEGRSENEFGRRSERSFDNRNDRPRFGRSSEGQDQKKSDRDFPRRNDRPWSSEEKKGGRNRAEKKRNQMEARGSIRSRFQNRGEGRSHSKDRRREFSPKRDDSGLKILTGEVQKNSRGFGFLLQEGGDHFIPAHVAAPLITGDVIKAWVSSSGEVLKLQIIKRAIKAFIGTYDSGFGKRTVTLADRTMKTEVTIVEPPGIPGLRSGNKVQVEITNYEPRFEGKIIRDFGAVLAPKFDTLAVVVKSQWPQEFSTEAINEAGKIAEEVQQNAAANGYKGRKDLRLKPFVTIDGKDSRDFDDAVLVEKTNSGYVLYVAIADVSEFVLPETKLDEEAYDRATSVYFPEWVIPMLPEVISNGSCSLRPDEEKLTLTCEMHFDENGKKKSVKIYESVIKSHRRCIYENVNEEWKKGDEFWKVPFELYELIKISRQRRGSLDLDLPESKIVLNEDSDTIDIKKVERLDAHKLIEEFMIAANESVTEVMEREKWPFIYRVHEPPKTEALERFEGFAIALGLKPNLGAKDDPRLLALFIDSLKEHKAKSILYYLMLRSLKQAKYQTENLKHFGLASKAYTHFTSPIRRYPDLMVHRLLKRFCRHEPFNETQKQEYLEYLDEACDHCSKQERKAEDLDRTVIKVKKARFMEKHYGETFNAMISNVSDKGLYIELEKWFVDGLVPIDELGDDYYEFIESRLMLKGKRTGKKYKIGEHLKVAVLRTDQENGFIDFTLAENLTMKKDEKNMYDDVREDLEDLEDANI